MAKNDFRVTSIFKIIIRICMKNIEFCGKTSKFLPKRCLFIFCIKKKREKQKHNPTSKASFLKLLKNCH